jgi:regulator of protease activity HflC (stomatin/prohibitin superfamily)
MGEVFAFIAASSPAWIGGAVLASIVVGLLWMLGRKEPRWERDERVYDNTFNKLSLGLIWILVFAMIFGIAAGISAYTTVERGTVGLITRYGRLTDVVFQPGLNWKFPFIEKVEIFDTTQQSYETSDHVETSKAQWPDYSVTSQTSDGQTVSIGYTLIFRIPDGEAAVGIRQNVGPIEEVVENCVKANSRSISRNTSRAYEASQLYSGDVVEYQDDVFDRVKSQFDATCGGLILVDFKVRGIGFEEKYSDAIEAKQIENGRVIKEQYAAEAAIHEAAKTRNLAKGEADAKVERALGDAEAVRIAADADAYAVEIDADAQAYATNEIGKALQKYEEVLQLRFIENLNSQTVWLPSQGFEFLLPAPE